jgi:hypothetical protein
VPMSAAQMETMPSEEQSPNPMNRPTASSSRILRKLVYVFLLMGTAGCWSQQPQPSHVKGQPFDGKWWSATTTDEHSGFINGAADCLTWTAHEKGFNATPEQLIDKIDKFYKDHAESVDLGVVEVWKKLWTKMLPRAAARPGETWKNAHWYLDGYWWLDETPDQKQGFVKGYLWCMKTHAPSSAETYSKPAGFYVEKIDAFTKANAATKADREKVASILKRYSDKEPK